jgi:uncharacterized protein
MAGREVFADTSALYAFVNKRDAHHVQTSQVVAKIAAADRPLVVTDYVVAEAINLANARAGGFVANRILDLIDQSEGIRIEWIGSTKFELAKTFFRKHAEHGYSFTDCTSFVVMRELRIKEVLTTDRHFAEAGFEVLLR